MMIVFSWKLYQMAAICEIFDINTKRMNKTCYPMNIIVKRLSHCSTLQGTKQNGKILKLFAFGELMLQQNDYLLVVATGRYETCGYPQESKQLKQLYQLNLLWLCMVLII